MKQAFCATGFNLALGITLFTAGASLAGEPEKPAVVATTPHFAFHSEFATNLNDALLEAGRARNKDRPELFHTGSDESCFSELPRHLRAAWDHAVDYYAEIISSEKWTQRQQFLIRLNLSGVEERDDPNDLLLVGIARSFDRAENQISVVNRHIRRLGSTWPALYLRASRISSSQGTKN